MLRLKKTNESLKVVVPWDPAIDLEKSDLKGYLEDLDFEKLKFKPGEDPSVVWLTPLPHWVMTKYYQIDMTHINRAITSSFRFAITKIDNIKQHLLTPQVEIEGGSHWEPTESVEGPKGEKIPCMSEEDAVLFFNRRFHLFVNNIMQVYGFLVPGTTKPYVAQLSSFLPTTEKKASK